MLAVFPFHAELMNYVSIERTRLARALLLAETLRPGKTAINERSLFKRRDIYCSIIP